jgi:ABC-2 type transport system permease protein
VSAHVTAALRMERVRVTTLRSTYLLVGLAILLGASVALILSLALRGDPLAPETGVLVLTSAAALMPVPLAAVLMTVLGVLAVGHDYRHGLVRPVLAAVPNRSAVMLARLAVTALVAAAVVILGVALNAAIALVVLGETPPFGAETRRNLVGYLFLIVLWSWLGAALTWLMRSTAATLTFIFLVPLLIEPLLVLLSSVPLLDWLTPIARWLPFRAGQAMVAPAIDGARSDPTALRGGMVFVGMVALILAAAWVRFTSTDA